MVCGIPASPLRHRHGMASFRVRSRLLLPSPNHLRLRKAQRDCPIILKDEFDQLSPLLQFIGVIHLLLPSQPDVFLRLSDVLTPSRKDSYLS